MGGVLVFTVYGAVPVAVVQVPSLKVNDLGATIFAQSCTQSSCFLYFMYFVPSFLHSAAPQHAHIRSELHLAAVCTAVRRCGARLEGHKGGCGARGWMQGRCTSSIQQGNQLASAEVPLCAIPPNGLSVRHRRIKDAVTVAEGEPLELRPLTPLHTRGGGGLRLVGLV